ncbi:unnamed protein product [Heterobilharzia americana]|nr:unnamed protein product [Heterobilharzia americana]
MRKATDRETRGSAARSMPRNIRYAETEATLRRNCMKKDKEESFWKLKEFEQKAVGRLNTFRNEECRKQSLLMHKNNKISRVGLYGQGIQRTGECA